VERRVADLIIDKLVENNINDCFAVVGGGAMHIDNALALNSKINKYFCHHEQSCAMAAEGYAKLTGKIAVVSVTSGPGALNTLNGVEGAYVDNTPMLVIAGHPRWDTTVNVTGLKLRYRGVQEFDIVPTVKGMTKYAVTVTNPLEVIYELQKAIDIALQGRRGPVWLSIPLDVQGAIVDTENLKPCKKIKELSYTLNDDRIAEINQLIMKSKRPVILAGSGIRSGNAVKAFREWITQINIPVLSGALLPDVMYRGIKNYYGTSGSNGERRGNFILQNSDLIVAIGNSMALKQTGFNQSEFAPNAKIVMIDAGEDEARKPGIKVDYFIYCDALSFIEVAQKMINPWNPNLEWIQYCDSILDLLGNIDEIAVPQHKDRIPAAYLWEKIRELMPDDEIIALGNSSGIVGGLQKSVITPYQRVIVNYNSGSMGDDLPEAIGASVASNKEVLCVTGDGSIMMNIQELQTIKHYNFPIKIIILSNEGYGAIRQTNKNFFDGLYIGCDKESGVSMPDFEKVVSAFDIPFKRCENCESIETSLKWLFNQKSASVLEVYQKINDPVSPKIMSKMNDDGSFYTPPLHDMAPYISKDLMDKLMKWKNKEN